MLHVCAARANIYSSSGTGLRLSGQSTITVHSIQSGCCILRTTCDTAALPHLRKLRHQAPVAQAAGRAWRQDLADQLHDRRAGAPQPKFREAARQDKAPVRQRGGVAGCGLRSGRRQAAHAAAHQVGERVRRERLADHGGCPRKLHEAGNAR